jgi:hypothetical protein
MPAETFRSRVAHAGAPPAAVPPEAAVELGEAVGDADAVPVGLNTPLEDAEELGANGALLGDEEPQPATNVAATSAVPVSSPRCMRVDSAIQVILSMISMPTS